MIRFDHHTQFITITNLNWLPILNNVRHKQIIIEALDVVGRLTNNHHNQQL